MSDIANITSGVIQGSCILGPILFLLYINDLSGVFTDNVCVKLYAEDVKLYTHVKVSSGDDVPTLQTDSELGTTVAVTDLLR